MLLSDIELMVRQDLFDSSAARWTNSDIDRAIDKAINRYSQYYPNIAFADMQMQPYQRTYPYPQSWNPAYPVLWIEKILYPLQIYGSAYAAPQAAPQVSAVAGSGLAIGSYKYLVTFITQGGETLAGPSVPVTTTGGSQQVNLSNIPVGPALPQQPGSAASTIIGRNLYRTQVGGSTFYLLAVVQDNSSTTFLDSASDSVLAGMPQPPLVNTSGVMVWPPAERAFAEYSNMYDTSVALASGGNMGMMGAIGAPRGPTGTMAPSFTLILSPIELPKDNSLVMRVFYATKQQLDNSGSTIPEVHRDIIVLGAVAYALEAYQVPTNDNFAFQNGGLYDRVDDTHIPASWLATARYKMRQFAERLEEIKLQRDFASSARIHWGDVPIRWTRL